MKNLIIVVLLLFTLSSYAQNSMRSIERKGFIIGLGVGVGAATISDVDQGSFENTQGGLSLPDLKLGWMINDQLAIIGTGPGMTYEYEGKKRNFGAIIPTLQYWIKDRWWVNGGFGLAMDSPSLFDVDEIKNEDWNFGFAVSSSTGYELVQKKNYALDLHAQVHLGRIPMDNDLHRVGAAISVGVGFTWF